MPSHVGPEKPGCPFALPAELVKALLPISRPVSYPRGAEIFHQADPCRGAFILLSGRTRISILAANDLEVYCRILEPGCVLGLPATLCGESYNTTSIAIETCELAWIATAELQEFIRTRPDLSIAIVQAMSRELADMNVRRANMSSCKSCGCPLAETCSHHLYTLE